jgi:hypothetical protein
MALMPWRRRRQLAEQAKLDELNRLMSDRGAVSFVEGPPYPDQACPSWENYRLYDPTSRGGSMATEMGIATAGALWRTGDLLHRCTRSARVAKWGDRYVVVYTLVNSDGQTAYYFGGNPMRPSWPLSSEEGYGRNVRAVWSRALKVWPLYRCILDGFVSCAQPSTGVYQVGDINEFSTGQFTSLGIDDEGLRDRARGCYPFYRSPGGDIVTLDITGQCPGRADLWHPHADPECDIDFWDTIDTLLTTTIDPHHNTQDN